MENLNIDVIILTSVVATLFIVFISAVYKEFKVMGTEVYTHTEERGPRAGLINLVAKIGNDKKLTKKEKKVVYNAMQRNIADMESGGVYFDENVKEKLREYRDELHCEYSGLPSPSAYEKQK